MPPVPRGAPRIAVAAAAGLAITIWGGTPIVTKIAVLHLDAVMVGILRTALAALLVAPLAVAVRSRLPPPVTPRGALQLALSALGGFVAFPLLFSLGLSYTSAAHAALILAALPVFSGLFAAAATRRLPGGRWWLGVAVAGLGEYLLVAQRLGFDGAPAALWGDLLVLGSCLAASLGYVAGARLSQRVGTWSTTLWGLTLAGVVLLPLLIIRADAVDWGAIGSAGWLAVAYLALLSSVLAYAAWYWALGTGGIARIAVSQFAQPVVSLVLAALVLGESITLSLALTAALILTGVAVAQSR